MQNLGTPKLQNILQNNFVDNENLFSELIKTFMKDMFSNKIRSFIKYNKNQFENMESGKQ